METKVILLDWGLIEYKEAWEKQTALHKELVDAKRSGHRKEEQGYFVVCEHPPVYTLGKSGNESHLLIGNKQLEEQGLSFYKINRGGDITHHGPGQLVGYPILDLEHWYRDVHRYVRNVEQIVIDTLAEYGVESRRIEGFTGVWTNDTSGKAQKLCAIGVHLSRWVSMHGFALNVNNDIGLFKNIVPCGISEDEKEVTSMKNYLGKDLNMNEVKRLVAANFERIFNCTLLTEKVHE